MAKKKKDPTSITYHFNNGVSVDEKDGHPAVRYEEGYEVQAELLPPHIDLQGLIAIGAIRPVEDKD
jgi:hypothetical protein